MSNTPDHRSSRRKFNSRYQVNRELGRSQEGVCITYLAKDRATQQSVILTRFVFAQSVYNRSVYQAHQQEIQLLRELAHPGIPRYLDSFPTPDGFCLVQEYKQVQSLVVTHNWTLEQIKQIAVSVLSILVYLQDRTPPILHRNIKPETIYVDVQMNVYLVDFSLAQIGGGDMPLSRTVGKQSGFVSPEQSRDRPASEASDIYSLGVTLMCLLTQTESKKVATLVGHDGCINVKGLVPTEVSLSLIDWLETMVSPHPKLRFPNAATALDALKPIDVNRLPDVRFNPANLEFTGNYFGEVLTQAVTVVNPITDTVLFGNWDIIQLSSAPRHLTNDAWISFEPAKFEGNKTVCHITVDTRRLMAGKTYKRQILLHANSLNKTHSLETKIQTAAIKTQKMLYVSLGLLLVVSLAGGWLGTLFVGITPGVINWIVLIIGLAIGSVGGGAATFSNIDLFVKTVGLMFALSTLTLFLPALGSDVDVVVGFLIGLVVAAVVGIVFKHHIEKKFSTGKAVLVSLLTAVLGMSLGVDLTLRFLNPLVAAVALGTALPLAVMVIRPYLKYRKLLYSYRKSERFLIKP